MIIYTIIKNHEVWANCSCGAQFDIRIFCSGSCPECGKNENQFTD
jgi:hypothetical protein